MWESLFSFIEKYDIITLYRHVSADSDAMGAQFALKTWIQDTYPNKQVYALGNSIGSCRKYFPSVDTVDDETVSRSLAVILDTANTSRIDDERWRIAQYRIKVDHHIFVETYAESEILCDACGATCEILARMFEKRQERLSKRCAEYLYSGIIADTLQFSIPATTPQMLRTAAYLLQFGVDVARINRENFSKSLVEFRYENYLRNHVVVLKDQLAYCKITKEEYTACGLTFAEAKEKVYVLGNVNEFEVWALFTEADGNNGERLYNGSLRSKNKQITNIAVAYGGGGHRYACGVKNLREETIDALLHDLLSLL